MQTAVFFFSLPTIAFATLTCDGKYFVCNHTDTHFTVDSVQLESASQTYWKAGDSINASFSGHLENVDIEDGTLFYDIWEFGVQYKVYQASKDYFTCDTHQCYRDKGLALHIQNPEDKNSNYTAKFQFNLPPQRASGTMSINIWGQDQRHEPGVYDFMINLRLQYNENLQKISVERSPRKFCSVDADCPSGSYCLNDSTKTPIPVYMCQGDNDYCKGDSDCPDDSYCMNYESVFDDESVQVRCHGHLDEIERDDLTHSYTYPYVSTSSSYMFDCSQKNPAAYKYFCK